MNRDNTPNVETLERGGGTNAAAPFWAFIGLALAAIFLLSHYALGSRDTLMALTPSKTVAYIHADRDAAALAKKLQPELGQLTPTETSLFAMQADGGLQWTTILRWHWPAELSDEERNRLIKGGALEIDDKTYALGATDYILLENPDVSLANHAIAAQALRNLRSATRIQGYLASTSVEQMAKLLTGETPNADYTGIPYAFGVTKHQKTNLLLIEASELTSRLGFKLPTRAQHTQLPLLTVGPGFDKWIAYSSQNSVNHHFLATIFRDTETDRIQNGVPESKKLAEAKTELAKILAGRLAVTLAITPNKPLDFAVLLPNADFEQLQNTLNKLNSAAYPTESEFTQPNGRTTIEYIYQPNQHQFSTKQTNQGVILASNPKILAAALNSIEKRHFAVSTCAPGASDLIQLNNLTYFGDYFPILSLFIDYPQLENGVIQRNGDNYVIFCG